MITTGGVRTDRRVDDDTVVRQRRGVPAGDRDSPLRIVAQERGVQIQGLRLKVSIERLLARLFHEPNPPWLLKGGYAMELRFRPKARTTRDLDLTLGDPVDPEALTGRLAEVHEALMNAAGLKPGDFFEFTIPPCLQGIDRCAWRRRCVYNLSRNLFRCGAYKFAWP